METILKILPIIVVIVKVLDLKTRISSIGVSISSWRHTNKAITTIPIIIVPLTLISDHPLFPALLNPNKLSYISFYQAYHNKGEGFL